VFSGVAIGTILVVGVAMLGSLDLPAAMLSMRQVDRRGRIPFLGRRRTARARSKFWACSPAPW